MLVFEVTDGELLASLTAQAQRAGVANGAIVSLIGAVDSFTVSTMPVGDAGSDNVSSYALPAELHGSGEIRDGAVHVHATLAVRGDRAIAGHLHGGAVGTWFVRAYVQPL